MNTELKQLIEDAAKAQAEKQEPFPFSADRVTYHKTAAIGAIMPCGTMVTNVKEAYGAGQKAQVEPNTADNAWLRFKAGTAQAEKQEPVKDEPVAFVHRNEAGQISIKASDGGSFDMSKYIGSSLYTRPQPDLTAEVERLKLSAEHWNRLYREKCQEFHDAQANKGHEIVWLIDRIAELEEAARQARDAFEQHDGNYKLSKASGAVVEAAIAKLDAVLGNAD